MASSPNERANVNFRWRWRFVHLWSEASQKGFTSKVLTKTHSNCKIKKSFVVHFLFCPDKTFLFWEKTLSAEPEIPNFKKLKSQKKWFQSLDWIDFSRYCASMIFKWLFLSNSLSLFFSIHHSSRGFEAKSLIFSWITNVSGTRKILSNFQSD